MKKSAGGEKRRRLVDRKLREKSEERKEYTLLVFCKFFTRLPRDFYSLQNGLSAGLIESL
jgi:hypothetical protein